MSSYRMKYKIGNTQYNIPVAGDKMYDTFGPSGENASEGLVPAPSTTAGTTKFLREDGTWVVPPNTTYSTFVKSGSTAAAGLVPKPSTTAGTTKFLREDGTWVVPTNTTYTAFKASGENAAAGLVPKPSTTAGTTKFLRESAAWAVPTATTASSIAANGYVKFANGLVLQWGFAAANVSSVTFPVAFGTAVYSISATTYFSEEACGYSVINGYSKTSFTFQKHYAGLREFWIAIGK